MLKYEKYLFYVLVLLSLSIIIVPQYYITGDGASHTYNAKVLFDYIFNSESRAFYKPFYQLNKTLDPNWTSHLLLGMLVQIFPAWLSDKIVQIAYILLFAFGIRKLIKTINPTNTFLSFIFFPLAFNINFQQGFYNYVLAISLMLFTISYYIKNKHKLNNNATLLRLCMWLIATVFTHGMPAIFCILYISFDFMFTHYADFFQLKYKTIFQKATPLILAVIPLIFILLPFMLKRGFETIPHHNSYVQKMKLFSSLFMFQSTRRSEEWACLILSLLFGILLAAFSLKKDKGVKNNATAFSILAMLVYTFVSYITSPHSIGGAGSVHLRFAVLPHLFFVLLVANAYWKNYIKIGFIAASFFITISFLAIRFPYILKANNIGKEMMQCSSYINAKSTVLNLHFNDWQKLPTGDSLFQYDGSFIHFTDYVGAVKNKPLFLINNYEAEINYFPVNFRDNKNIRYIEPTLLVGNYLPYGNYKKYEQQAKCSIDYILLQNWNNEMLQNSKVKNMFDTIHAHYTKTFESEHQYVMLFKKNILP